VESILGQFSTKAPFADEPGVVPALAQQLGIAPCVLFAGHGYVELIDSVAGGVLARKDAGAACATDGIGDEGMGEAHTVGGELVQCRRVQVGGTGTAHHVVALIVGEEENQVGTLGRLGGPCQGGGRQRGGGGGDELASGQVWHCSVIPVLRSLA